MFSVDVLLKESETEVVRGDQWPAYTAAVSKSK